MLGKDPAQFTKWQYEDVAERNELYWEPMEANEDDSMKHFTTSRTMIEKSIVQKHLATEEQQLIHMLERLAKRRKTIDKICDDAKDLGRIYDK